MAVPIGQWAFNAGEVRPALFGHADLVKLHSAASTMRNMWCYYSGGTFSRAGTAFVGYSAQTIAKVKPRLINFQFSTVEGRILEFGNFYMRVIANGAYVTDASLPLASATNANPLVIGVPANGGSSASPINTNVISSYNAGDLITLAGGVFSVPAKLKVQLTELVGIVPSLGFGTGYVPADTITLFGGSGTAAVVTVGTTQVNAATVTAAGSGGTQGTATVTGTTGTGTQFEALVNIDSSGKITAVISITVPGSYTVNPSSPTAEPVTGAGLSGATLNLSLGPATVSITNPGAYAGEPAGGVFTQAGTSGLGTGAQFQNALFGIAAVSISTLGSYTTTPPNPVLQASTSGAGAGAEFNVSFTPVAAFGNGDWLFFSGVGGMTQLDGRTLIVAASLGGGHYVMEDVFGVAVDSTHFSAFTAGGTVSRIYTAASPFSQNDLAWMKFAQSADVMSITCVNQDTGVEYPPHDLERIADNDWTFVNVTMEETIAAPGSCFLTATFNWSTFEAQQPSSSSTPAVASYQYGVTAVNPVDGSESVMSPIGQLLNAVDISSTQGTVNIFWTLVPPAGAVVPAQYNIYKATPTVQAAFSGAPPPPVGALFGFIGTAFGNTFADNNIIADFSQTPPRHSDPFSRGQVIGINVVATGAGYTFASVVFNSITGTEAQYTAIIQGGGVVGYLQQNNGRNYSPGDTVTITGDGSGARAAIQFGAFSGTYPGTVSYFQARRGYANTLNNPDTYWWSQPGAFTNFDIRIPTLDSDAVTGSPWGQQVDGIQWFVVMPGGTIALTGLGAWFVGGQGSSSFNPQPLTPQGQQALPETFNGASPTVPPVRIDYDIVFVQRKGARYRDVQVQYFTNIITGVDISLASDHLFLGHQIIEHAWCEEPYKLLWSVREDGILLSLTYYKPQEVLGWARHDTQGDVVSVASITEEPVDALYMAVKRFDPFRGPFYSVERMDNRLWTGGVESTWCVDSGLTTIQPAPNVPITIFQPGGVGSLVGVTDEIGGSGYSPATHAIITDANGSGPGAGAVAVFSTAGGIINGISFSPAGSQYTSPAITFVDPSGHGSGASASIILNSQIEIQAGSAVFNGADVGRVVRAGGGIATITSVQSSTIAFANLTQPFSTGFQISGGATFVQFFPGQWTMTQPTNVVGGLFHLEGQTVTGLMDGNPIPPTVVSVLGQIVLPAPASAITVGLGFTAQLQSVYLEAGSPTIQGQRKKIGAVTARVENSRGIQIGSDQVDGSTLSPIQVGPAWLDMKPAPDLGQPAYDQGVVPLWTGDTRVAVPSDLGKPGQVALQQINPLPMNVTALIPESLEGDTPSQQAPKKQQQGGGGGR